MVFSIIHPPPLSSDAARQTRYVVAVAGTFHFYCKIFQTNNLISHFHLLVSSIAPLHILAVVGVNTVTVDAIDAAAVDEATHRQKGMSIGAGSFCFYFTAFSSSPAASAPHHQQTVNQTRREEPRAPLTPNRCQAFVYLRPSTRSARRARRTRRRISGTARWRQ